MAAQSDQVTIDQLLLAEYECIKHEQRSRVGFRDNLIYATLASLAGVVAAILQAPGRPELLLLLPPVSVVLGWTYLVNDEKTTAIGRYIRDDLGPRLSALLPGEPRVFGWEAAHRSDPRRQSRKLLQLVADLTTFCLPPVAALVLFAIGARWPDPYLAVAAVEAVAVLVLAGQMTRYADLDPGAG